MAELPDPLPRWATEDQIDPVSGQLNVVEPPEGRKDSGWERREIPPRQWKNWFMRGVTQAVAYFAARDSRVDTFTTSELPSSPSTEDGTPLAFVSDIPALAYFDGTDWRRADTNGVI